MKTVIVPRGFRPDPNTVVSDEALEIMAKDLQTRKTIDVRDSEGNVHPCILADVTVTARGIEAHLSGWSGLAKVMSSPPVSMGCSIHTSECAICEDEG